MQLIINAYGIIIHLLCVYGFQNIAQLCVRNLSFLVEEIDEALNELATFFLLSSPKSELTSIVTSIKIILGKV